MCPKEHLSKVWLPTLSRCGILEVGWVNGPVRGRGDWDPRPFFFSDSGPWFKQTSSETRCLPCAHLSTGPKATGPGDNGLNPLKLWVKINLSFCKLFFLSYFCHHDERFTSTPTNIVGKGQLPKWEDRNGSGLSNRQLSGMHGKKKTIKTPA